MENLWGGPRAGKNFTAVQFNFKAKHTISLLRGLPGIGCEREREVLAENVPPGGAPPAACEGTASREGERGGVRELPCLAGGGE